jgi:dihydroorotate dehydrogenase electron transfer subunit
MNVPEMVRILEMRKETPTVKTLVLDKEIHAKPGQFAMLWIPNVGEKPFSFSKLNGNVEITARKVGTFTEELLSLKKGDLIGFRGPYGDGHFKLRGKRICVCAGGVGLAPMMPLIGEILSGNRRLTVIVGASTESELLWVDRLRSMNMDPLIATDDGTCGEKGSVCDILNNLVKREVFDQIYSCGPELMMRRVADISITKKIRCQLSLERYMKCGMGICGQCCIDPSGLRVCKDGPVFTAEELRDTEFGKYRRDASGSLFEL